MSKTLQDLIAGTSELRSLPSTTMRLMDLLDDATVGADEVLAVIEKDPSLTANLLKLCNSAYYGLRRQVGTARQALVLLGNRTIVNLAFAASMGDVLRGPLTGYHMERNQMWHHALGTALGAAHLASRQPDVSLRERAFTAGLVHDIGKLLLNGALKQKLVQLPSEPTAAALQAAEVQIMGFDHAEAGAALAQAWNFPPALVDLIAGHHRPGGDAVGGNGNDPEAATLAAAVAGANAVAAWCGFGGGATAMAGADLTEFMANLGYEEALVDEFAARLPGDLDTMLSVIGESR